MWVRDDGVLHQVGSDACVKKWLDFGGVVGESRDTNLGVMSR